MSKKVNIYTGISACVGLVLGSCCFLSVGQGAANGGESFVFSIIPVGVLFLFLTLSCSELNDILPECNGCIPSFFNSTLGPVASIFVNIMSYFVTPIVIVDTEALLCGKVIQQFLFPNSSTAIPIVIACILTIILCIINCFGVDFFAKIQNITFTFMIITLLTLAIVGCFGISPFAETVVNPKSTYTGIFGILETGIWAAYLFLGIEMVMPLSSNMKNPKKDIRISMMVGVLILAVVYMMLSQGLYNYIPVDILADGDTPNITYAGTIFGKFGYYWMGIATIFAAVSTMNTGIQSNPRMLAASAKDGIVPQLLAKTNKHGAPVIAIALIGVIMIVLDIIFGTATLNTLLMLGCLFYMITYTGLHVLVLILRKRYPNAPRNKRFTFLGIPQIIGIIGFVYMGYTMAQDPFTLKFCLIIAIASIIYAFLWAKYIMKVSAFKAIPNEDMKTYATKPKSSMQGILG